MQCEACGHGNIEGARFCAGCGVLLPEAVKAQDPLVGQVIGGRYRITGVLGEGGMGVVYAGEQQMGSTVRKVAVKTLHPHLSKDPSVLARFHRECGTVAQLEHPNTIKFYDFGATPDGTLYIAMEFVNGKALSEVVTAGGAMAPERVLKIMKQVCGALDEAHEQGIVHRDLKPENIILTPLAGEPDFVKVLDFGIAARSESSDAKKEQKLTQQGMVLGTPPYMSPEQFTGRALDRRSDIYSLAVVTYEMLTGRLPFEADTPWEWATQHMTAQPTPFEAAAPSTPIPEGMRRGILRGLSKDPAERQPTAKEFYRQLSSGDGIAPADAAKPPPASTGTAAMAVTPDFGPTVPAAAAPGLPMAPVQAGFAPQAPAAAYAVPRPSSRTAGGGKGLVIGLVGLGAVLLVALGVAALVTLRPTSDDSGPLANPFQSVSAAPATLVPQTETVVSAVASAAIPPEVVEDKPTPRAVPASTRRKETTATGGKPSGTSPAPAQTSGPAGDACAQCIAAARTGNVTGAVGSYGKCTDPAQKERCSRHARAAAPQLARAAAFNGQCAQAKAIIAAAANMGASSPELNGVLQGTRCQ
jgi:serine/threonine-protein kinase